MGTALIVPMAVIKPHGIRHDKATLLKLNWKGYVLSLGRLSGNPAYTALSSRWKKVGKQPCHGAAGGAEIPNMFYW